MPEDAPGDQNRCRQQESRELRKAVDDAVGAGYERAFGLLEDIAADARNACICQRCRTRAMMLGLVLRRELRLLDERLCGRW